MKKIAFFAALCVVSFPVLAQNPFSFGASYTADTYYNTTGGLSTGGGFMGMANITAGFDTEAAGLWRGGQFFVNGAGIHGRSLTENYLGDLQVASNIDAGEHTCLHELWFRQRLGRLAFTAGLQDLNAEFMVTEGGKEFINSSFGTPSVIALGVPVPIFPLTGLGVVARWDITGRFAIQGALFDGTQTGFDRNHYNIRWSLGRGDGVLAMCEIHLDGRYKLGGYYHSRDGNWGIHASVDQPLSDRVALFAQTALAPKSKNENNLYLGIGANLQGLFSRHRCDALGLAVAHAGLHNASLHSAGLHSAAHSHETAVELYYKYNFGDNFALQPDLQYIINPSGTDVRLPNALVGILRLALSF